MTEEGFVLAGGKSRRMGRDKALLIWRGETLLGRAVKTLRSLQIKVSLVLAAGQDLKIPGCAICRDVMPGAGPLGGLLTALENSHSEVNYLLACDLPLATADLLRALREFLGEFDAVIPTDSLGEIHPLCGLYRKSCLATVRSRVERGLFRMQDLARSERLVVRLVGSPEHGQPDSTFFNVNTPGDFERL